MSEGYENIMKSSSSMNAIQKEAEANPMLQDALHDSLESVKLLMSTTFQRLVLKDVPYEAASQHQMSGLWNCVGDMDPKLKLDMKAKKDISGCPDLKAFIDHCCQIKHYAFSIKKCGKLDCSICLPTRLPLEEFGTLSFLPVPSPDDDNLMSSMVRLPSLKDGRGKQSHGMPFSPSGQTASNVGELILCSECLRPRVTYSKHKLNHYEIEVLLRSIEPLLFLCVVQH